MNRVQKAILPAFLLSSTLIVMLTRLIASPQFTVQAMVETVLSTPVADAESLPTAIPASLDAAVAESTEGGEAIKVEAIPAQTDNCSIGQSFPDSIRQWCGWIEAYASQNGVEPQLIAAVMLQESGGDPNAYSHSGAVGLLQVMPRDGLAANFMCPNGPCFSDRPSTDELYDPNFNIAYGSNMLADLIIRHGNARDALKSYGPKDVGYYYADLVLDIYHTY